VGRRLLCRDILGAAGSAARSEVSHKPQALGLGVAEGILASSTGTDTLHCAKYNPANVESIKINDFGLK